MDTTERFFDGVPPSQMDLIFKILDQAIIEESADKEAKQIREIIPIEQWLNYSYYLGPWAKDLYPYWKEEIVAFSKRRQPELLVTGSIGTGKSSMALIAMARKLYELSCYDSPQRLFGLSDLTDIFFAYLSLNYKHAERTGFGQFRTLVDNIPYFQKEFPRDSSVDSVLKFPNKISIIPGTDNLSIISTNLFGCVMDESDFHRRGSSHVGGDMNKASAIYSEVSDRRKSRFMVKGYDPGFAAIISSASFQTSFLSRRISAARKDNSAHISVACLWDVKPDKYSKERFYVFKGSDKEDAFVVDSIDDISHLLGPTLQPILADVLSTSSLRGDKLIKKFINSCPPAFRDNFITVPMELRQRFREDVYTSLKNLAGYAVSPTGKLFSSKAVWHKNIAVDIKHPFSKVSFSVPIKGSAHVMTYFKPEMLFRQESDGTFNGLKRHAGAPRFVHIDQSISKDRTGFAVCHVAGWKEDPDTLMRVPIIEFDILLAITPPPKPDKISIAKVRKFLFDLRNMGMQFGMISYDQFQSSDSMQILENQGFPVSYQSVDRTDAQYKQFVDLLYEERIRMYQYDILESEMFNLDHDPEKQKVDHPETNEDGSHGSKDVGDAAVGALNNCLAGATTVMREVGEVVEEIALVGLGQKDARVVRLPSKEDWITGDYGHGSITGVIYDDED